MFAIYIYNHDTLEEGWFKSLKDNHIDDLYTGEQRFTPVFADDISKRKLWKSEKAAIKYANTLRDRFERIQYFPQELESKRYRHRMFYNIRVYDVDNGLLIHEIRQLVFFSFSAWCKRK